MNRIFLILILFFACPYAHADTIILKSGAIIEGKVTEVRGIFLRVESDYKQPFREFLLENVANIESSDPDVVSQRAVQDLHAHTMEAARSEQLLREVNKIAGSLIEEALQGSGSGTLSNISEDVKAAVKEKAGALIGEAVKNTKVDSLEDTPEEIKAVARFKANVLIEEAVKTSEPPKFNEASEEVRQIARKKAGGIIEEAVKDVEITSLARAPQGVQLAAKKAASALIEEAVIDAQTRKTGRAITRGDGFNDAEIAVHTLDDEFAGRDARSQTPDRAYDPGKASEGVKLAAKKVAAALIQEAVLDAKVRRESRFTAGEENPGAVLPMYAQILDAQPEYKAFLSTRKERISVGLLAVALITMLWIMAKNKKDAVEAQKKTVLTSSLKEIDRELEQLETSIKTVGPPTEDELADAKWDSTSQALEKSYVEKRKSPRVKWEHPVQLSLDKVLPISAVFRNVSLGGAFAVCNDQKLFRVGDQCRFKAGQDTAESPAKSTSWAQVVRIQPGRGVALKFLDLDKSSSRSIHAVIEGSQN